jgi:hypothetical protein
MCLSDCITLFQNQTGRFSFKLRCETSSFSSHVDTSFVDVFKHLSQGTNLVCHYTCEYKEQEAVAE